MESCFHFATTNSINNNTTLSCLEKVQLLHHPQPNRGGLWLASLALAAVEATVIQ
jgi:hypothetical protein